MYNMWLVVIFCLKKRLTEVRQRLQGICNSKNNWLSVCEQIRKKKQEKRKKIAAYSLSSELHTERIL